MAQKMDKKIDLVDIDNKTIEQWQKVEQSIKKWQEKEFEKEFKRMFRKELKRVEWVDEKY